MNSISLILSGAMAAGADGGGFWMPARGGEWAARVDALFYFIFYLSLFFFVAIVATMVVFVIRYGARKGRKAEKTATHSTALEVTWSVIPLILVIVIFYWGFRLFMDMAYAPANAYDINVTGQKWNWLFTYPRTGYVSDELHIPSDRPVRLSITSEDVIHSLYIPAFRKKMDAVPGRYSTLWLQATPPPAGETFRYDIFCAEYCGTSHSTMVSKLVVHPPGEFEGWLEQASNWLESWERPLHEAGEILFKKHGCYQCHSVDGSGNTGPSFLGLFGRSSRMKSGKTIAADENYLRESILNPQTEVVAGYQPVMPTYQGRLRDSEITALIEYVKTLAPGKTSGGN